MSQADGLLPAPRVWTISHDTEARVLIAWGSDEFPTYDGLNRPFERYRVLRSADSVNFSVIGETQAECWFDRGLQCSTVYEYQVLAVRSDSTTQTIIDCEMIVTPGRRSLIATPPDSPYNYEISPAGAGRRHTWDCCLDNMDERSLMAYFIEEDDSMDDGGQPNAVIWENESVTSWQEPAQPGSTKGYYVKAVDWDLQTSKRSNLAIGTAGGNRRNLILNPDYGYGVLVNKTYNLGEGGYNLASGIWYPDYTLPEDHAQLNYANQMWTMTTDHYNSPMSMVLGTSYGMPPNVLRAVMSDLTNSDNPDFYFLNDQQSGDAPAGYCPDSRCFIEPNKTYSVSAWFYIDPVPVSTSSLMYMDVIQISHVDDRYISWPQLKGMDWASSFPKLDINEMTPGWNRIFASFKAPPWAYQLEVSISSHYGAGDILKAAGCIVGWGGVMVTEMLEDDLVIWKLWGNTYQGHEEGGWELTTAPGVTPRLWNFNDLLPDYSMRPEVMTPPCDYFDGDSSTGYWTDTQSIRLDHNVNGVLTYPGQGPSRAVSGGA